MNPRILTALPVYNESEHLGQVLDEVRRYADQILVVDDGSSDETPRLLAREQDLHVVTHSMNQGYGAALRTAFEYAMEQGFDILVTIDCDGQHEPRLIPEIARHLADFDDGPCDLVSGSRYFRVGEAECDAPADRRKINRQVTEELNQRLGLSLTDAFCGFKAYRVDALANLEITECGYAMPLQLWVQAVCLEWNIIEFPVPLIYLDENRSFGGTLDDAQQRLDYYRSVLRKEIVARRQGCGAILSSDTD